MIGAGRFGGTEYPSRSGSTSGPGGTGGLAGPGGTGSPGGIMFGGCSMYGIRTSCWAHRGL